MSQFEVPRSFSPDHYRSVASAYFDQSQYESCVEVCRRGVAEHANVGSLWELLGCAAWVLRDLPLACSALEHATMLVPLRVPSRLVLAECYLVLQSREAAFAILRYLARGETCPTELQPRLAGLLFRAGDFRPAANVWHRLRRQNPSWAEAHYRYALCQWARDVPPEELFEPLNEAVVLAPGVPRYALTLANVWMTVGDETEAAASLADVDPADVRCGCCLRRMAAIYAMAGEVRLAEECDHRAGMLSRVKPDDTEDLCDT